MFCMRISVVTLGYPIELLDACYCDNLAGSVTLDLCIRVSTRSRLDSLVEILGHSLKFFVLD